MKKDVIIQVVIALLASDQFMSVVIDKCGPTMDQNGNCVETGNQSRAKMIVDQAVQIVGSIVNITTGE